MGEKGQRTHNKVQVLSPPLIVSPSSFTPSNVMIALFLLFFADIKKLIPTISILHPIQTLDNNWEDFLSVPWHQDVMWLHANKLSSYRLEKIVMKRWSVTQQYSACLHPLLNLLIWHSVPFFFCGFPLSFLSSTFMSVLIFLFSLAMVRSYTTCPMIMGWKLGGCDTRP